MHNFERTLPTNYNENYYVNPHYIWKACADDQLINRFIEIGESLEQSEARIGSHESSKADDSVRVSRISWIRKNENSKDIFDFLVDKIDRINYWHYGMILNGMEDIQYTRYPIGGHYKYHNDIIVRKENNMRKLSLVMSLSSVNDYEGGELLLNPHGEVATRIKLDKGDLIAFPSFVPHKVTPVTAGHRITAVTWVVGPKFV